MKAVYLGLLVVLSACKQYVTESEDYSQSKNVATLASSECKNQDLVYATLGSSAVTWSLEQVKGAANEKSPVTSKNPVTGKITLTKGRLNQAQGVLTFNVDSTSTGDPVRDRLLKEVLFDSSQASPFRFTIDKLIGESTAVANGGSVDMKASGHLELGTRKAALMMPVKISEKDGVFSLVGALVLDPRETRPALNRINLDDKLSTIESALSVKFSKSLNLDFNFQFKNDCVGKK